MVRTINLKIKVMSFKNSGLPSSDEYLAIRELFFTTKSILEEEGNEYNEDLLWGDCEKQIKETCD
ncbi:hypothetical protein N9875_00620 [bacterium]|nr:hypothetical protein [bacterium]